MKNSDYLNLYDQLSSVYWVVDQNYVGRFVWGFSLDANAHALLLNRQAFMRSNKTKKQASITMIARANKDPEHKPYAGICFQYFCEFFLLLLLLRYFYSQSTNYISLYRYESVGIRKE